MKLIKISAILMNEETGEAWNGEWQAGKETEPAAFMDTMTRRAKKIDARIFSLYITKYGQPAGNAPSQCVMYIVTLNTNKDARAYMRVLFKEAGEL